MTQVTLHAFSSEYGYIDDGSNKHIFISVKQCYHILQELFLTNYDLEDVRLIGHHGYVGTDVTNDIAVVLQSLNPYTY